MPRSPLREEVDRRRYVRLQRSEAFLGDNAEDSLVALQETLHPRGLGQARHLASRIEGVAGAPLVEPEGLQRRVGGNHAMYLLREGAGRIELVGGRINPENRNQPQRG